MKLQYFALLIAIFFTSDVVSSSVNRPIHLERSLRVHKQRNQKIEERGMISAATEKFKSMFTPSNIPTSMLDKWVTQQKSPKDVFIRLKLNNARTRLFEDPQFSTWVKYLTKRSDRFLGETILTTLKSKYSDDLLSQMVISAKKITSTQVIATKVQNAQLSMWRKARKPADKVFNLLQLEKTGEHVFNIPEFTMWTKYVKKLEGSNADKVIFATLSTHHADDALSSMLIAAKKIPDPEHTFSKLRTEQIQSWLRKEKSADDVFMLLQLNKADDKLFGSSEFALWSKYLDDIKDPNKEKTILATLSAHYNDKAMLKLINAAKDNPAMNGVVTTLETAQTKKWLAAGTSPDKVFKFYQLDQVGDKLLASPQLRSWVTYMQRFNAANPTKEPTTQLGTFRKVFGDEDLAQILIKAKGVDETKDIASKLLKEQIDYWLKSKQKVKNVGQWLGMTKEKPSDIEKAAYNYYHELFMKQAFV
ncbi:RxLR effector protein [Phytophthora megakarya]|uniref:RxLR effector protein n=1 Tax=Phytophthora megakarya TaxID=4795 RepID=A0A225V2X7_9STRA|nr:RxLR effector protein [Phytophthora megakarya]